jgi:hypothetical protein
MRRSAWLVVLLASLLVISIGCGGGSTPIVTPTPTPTASAVAISFAAPTPVALAQKIGAGNWMVTSVPSGGPLMLQLPPGTTQYGVAFLCESIRFGSQVNQEFIVEADIKDGSSYSLQLCLPDATATPTRGSFTGSFDATAIAGFNRAQVSVNDFSATAGFNTTTGSFNLQGLPGTTDVYATAFDSLNNLLAMKIVRGQTVPGIANGGNPITVGASDAITTSMPISLANIPAGGFSAPLMVPFPSYVSAHGSAPVGVGFPLATQYAVVNATEAQPADYYSFNLVAGATTEQVQTRQLLKTAAPVTLTLPNPWAATPPAPARFPTFIFNYTGLSGQPAIADHASLGWTQGGIFFGITAIATANSQNGATTLTMPDLTALPGFFAMAPAGTPITWVTTTWGGTAQFYVANPTVPETISNASDQGTFTQP